MIKRKAPIVSVVMPVYNAEKYVAEAIESILNQTLEDFEFIIVDDGSTDKSLEIIKEYAKKDKRIKTIKNKGNIGNWASRNVGMNNARGKYIVTQDSDDLSNRDRIKIQVSVMEKNPNFGVVGSNIGIIDGKGNKIGYRKYLEDDIKLRKMIYYFSPFANPAVIIRRDALKKSGIFDPKLRVSGDLDLWFRIGGQYEFGNVAKELVKYRNHEDQITSKKLKLMERTANKIRWKNWNNQNYHFGFKAFIYNFLHLVSIYTVPSKVKLWMFEKIRKQ